MKGIVNPKLLEMEVAWSIEQFQQGKRYGDAITNATAHEVVECIGEELSSLMLFEIALGKAGSKFSLFINVITSIAAYYFKPNKPNIYGKNH